MADQDAAAAQGDTDTAVADDKPADNTLLGDSSDAAGKDQDQTAAKDQPKAKEPDATPAAQDSKSEPEGKKAPESYDIKLSDDSVIEEADVTVVSDLSRELDLTNEQAVKVAALVDGVVSRHFDQTVAELGKTTAEWRQKVESDPEIGGKNLDSTVQFAKAALAKFGNEGLMEVLNETGLGNNPEMVRFVANIGKAMEDDSFVSSAGGKAGEEKTQAKTLYPELP
jgi:hypothetical protein